MTSVSFISNILGPRVSSNDLLGRRMHFVIPTIMLSLARLALIISVFLPYWHMTLEAPQYPNGLELTAYVNHLEGDVREIDGLNHYIGMRKLNDAASLERALGVWVVIAMVVLIEMAGLVHTKWALLLVIPALLFPVGFLVDLQFWLYSHGHNLDPAAPLSSSVKPFVPPALGVGTIGQFRTIASAEAGWYFACASSLFVAAALFFHRRAFKPLFDKMQIAKAGG